MQTAMIIVTAILSLMILLSVVVDVAQAGYNNHLVVGVDHFGRTFDVMKSTRDDRQVGLFYFLWLGQHPSEMQGIYDASIISAVPGGHELLYSLDHVDPEISPPGQYHFWSEPLWGYYNSADEWVVRRHVEMLTIAGVDFLVFDTTNAFTYRPAYLTVMRVIDELIKEGWNPPKVAFYTHSASIRTVRELYNDLYRLNLYADTWYRIDGKPLIIAYTNKDDDIAEARSRGDHTYNPDELSTEMLAFFHFRKPQWPFDPVFDDGFPWIEWVFPPPLHTDVMNVSVASHPSVPMSASLTRAATNWGRGWDPVTQQNIEEDVDRGTFFQSQWDYVIEQDPPIVFVTGWNEWIALKSPYMGEYAYVDAADKQYSRDIEPMKGAYEDAFYLQLIQNIRRYKSAGGHVSPAQPKSIDIQKGSSQWASIENVYRRVGEAAVKRDHQGFTSGVWYEQEAPRNNISNVKVSHDDDNVYFYIQTADAVSPYDGSSTWMNIFIGTGEPGIKGWEGYEYVINRAPKDGLTIVERLSDDFSGTVTGTAKYTIDGEVMQFQIPREALSLHEGVSMFYFKVADGVAHPEDLMDYYVSGMSFPLGRLSYAYVMK